MESSDILLKEISDKDERSLRIRKEFKKGGILLGAGLIYLIWCNFCDLRIPCIFHTVTGLKCPGCGMTRAFVSLSRLDFTGALGYNALSVTVIPILTVFLICQEIRFIKTGVRLSKNKKIRIFEIVLLAIMVAVTMLYGILRNILIG